MLYSFQCTTHGPTISGDKLPVNLRDTTKPVPKIRKRKRKFLCFGGEDPNKKDVEAEALAEQQKLEANASFLDVLFSEGASKSRSNFALGAQPSIVAATQKSSSGRANEAKKTTHK